MNTTNTSPARLAVLAPAIAAALPGLLLWTAKPNRQETEIKDDCCLVRSDGFSLWMRQGGYGNVGRIKIVYDRPRNRKGEWVEIWATAPATGKVEAPDITVAETREPEAIAKAIASRLLPEAEALHKLVLERIARDNDYETRRIAFRDSLSVAAGVGILADKNANGTERRDFYIRHPDFTETNYDTRYVGEVELNSANSATIKVDCDERKALALIAFLRSPAYLGAEKAAE